MRKWKEVEEQKQRWWIHMSTSAVRRYTSGLGLDTWDLRAELSDVSKHALERGLQPGGKDSDKARGCLATYSTLLGANLTWFSLPPGSCRLEVPPHPGARENATCTSYPAYTPPLYSYLAHVVPAAK